VTLLYTSSVFLAVCSQENFSALLRESIESLFLRPSSFTVFIILSANPPMSPGSTSIPASPTTSPIDELSEHITGIPQLIASRGGKPNPSKSEVYIKISAWL